MSKITCPISWVLVNRLPKIQTVAEFSILMSEHFVGLPPFGGTRNYAHGRKGPFRTSYWTLKKLVSLHQKSHQNLSLLNFKFAARIITPRGKIYITGRGRTPGISKTTSIKLKWYPSLICVGVATIDVYPSKVPIQKQKNEKSPKYLLNEKHLKTCQVGLW